MNPVHEGYYSYEPCSKSDCLDVVMTVATSVLFAAAVSLTIYFSLNPGTQMVQLAPNCSISLPLLVTSSTGAVLGTILLVQLVRRKQVYNSFLKAFRYPIRYGFHSGGRKWGKTVRMYHAKHGHRLHEVSFYTRDGVRLRGIWKFLDQERPTVIIFHGSGDCAMKVSDNLGRYYFEEKEFNTFCVEYRGYGISEGKAVGPNQEMEAYLDAEAALYFVLNQGVNIEQIVAHGFSIGGVYAAALGYFFDVPKVVLDHTLTSAEDAATSLMRVIPRFAIRDALQTAYAEGELPPLEFGVRPLKTDGFNTLAKVRAMSGRIFVIRGERDWLMPMRFGQELSEANPSDSTTPNLVTLPGGHSSDIIDFVTNQYQEQLEAFSSFIS